MICQFKENELVIWNLVHYLVKGASLERVENVMLSADVEHGTRRLLSGQLKRDSHAVQFSAMQEDGVGIPSVVGAEDFAHFDRVVGEIVMEDHIVHVAEFGVGVVPVRVEAKHPVVL